MTAKDWVTIVVALIGLAGTIVTVIWGNKKNAEAVKAQVKEQSDVTLYRIDQLEEKVNKHNNLIDRMYKLEGRVKVDEEKLNATNERIDHLHGE